MKVRAFDNLREAFWCLYIIMVLVVGTIGAVEKYQDWMANLHMTIPNPPAPSVWNHVIVHQDKDGRVTKMEIAEGGEPPEQISVFVPDVRSPCSYEDQKGTTQIDCAWLIATLMAEPPHASVAINGGYKAYPSGGGKFFPYVGAGETK